MTPKIFPKDTTLPTKALKTQQGDGEKKQRKGDKETHQKRQYVLSAEHVGGRLPLKQPPIAEQARRVQRRFQAGARYKVPDEELLTCSGGRSGTSLGRGRRIKYPTGGSGIAERVGPRLPSSGKLSLSFSLQNVSHCGTVQRGREDEKKSVVNLQVEVEVLILKELSLTPTWLNIKKKKLGVLLKLLYHCCSMYIMTIIILIIIIT